MFWFLVVVRDLPATRGDLLLACPEDAESVEFFEEDFADAELSEEPHELPLTLKAGVQYTCIGFILGPYVWKFANLLINNLF